jgi:type II secretory pathway pseudopilin PulG
MQIKNQREAFSMLTAIIIIVLMASVSLFVMNLSAKMTRETTAQYQREQAMLYAKSYTEYAIMAVTGNNRAVNCLSDINATLGDPNNGGYRIEVHLAYIGNNAEIGGCTADRQLYTTVVTPGSPLNIIVDTYVRYKEPDHPNPANTPFITYHKRTLQKI